MFDRYNVRIFSKIDGSPSKLFCDTYFYTIDKVIKFIVRFDYNYVSVKIDDLLFEDRFINPKDLINIWNSKGDLYE